MKNLMKNKRVVITGGLGFIGSHLAERLMEDNEVTIIDDQSTGKMENIRHIDNENLHLILGSINDLNLRKIFEDKDYVFHQAANSSVPASISEPKLSCEVNIDGTLNMLVAARDCGVRKVVYASSSAVYGGTSKLPLLEDFKVNPSSPYAVTKVVGELYCQVFNDLYGLPTISLRYFNVFGPKQDPNSQYAAVIPKFTVSMLKNESPAIYGDGMQSRDFIFVTHVVDANILASLSNRTGIFNIASGKARTINQLFKDIKEISGTDIEPIYKDPRSGDIKHSLADISKAKSFGFSPKISFKEELTETINWFMMKEKNKL